MMTSTNGVRFTFGSNPKNYTCCICKRKYFDYGNNPQPISQNPKDRCCNACNQNVVLVECMPQASSTCPSWRGCAD